MLIKKILLKISTNIAHRSVIDKYLQKSVFLHFPYYSTQKFRLIIFQLIQQILNLLRMPLPARPPSSQKQTCPPPRPPGISLLAGPCIQSNQVQYDVPFAPQEASVSNLQRVAMPGNGKKQNAGSGRRTAQLLRSSFQGTQD